LFSKSICNFDYYILYKFIISFDKNKDEVKNNNNDIDDFNDNFSIRSKEFAKENE